MGSSRGLGRELALKLGKLRSTVICIDIHSPELDRTSHTVKASGGSSSYYQCDVTNKEQVERTISTIAREVGDVTMLFHCCSIPSPRAIVTNPPSVKQTIDVSITSYFHVSFCFVWTLIELSANVFIFLFKR